MNAKRKRGQWPAWIDDILAFEPVAELEPEWRAEIARGIVKALDQRAGLVVPATCKDCGSLLTLHCTIRGCGLPKMPLRWRIGAWIRKQRRWRQVRLASTEGADDVPGV